MARARRAPRGPSARGVEVALAGIAHDIRTPLTGIVALSELLASSDLGPREREWANALKSGAEHLAGLSTLIVDAVRADVAGLTLRDERFSPRALAEAVGQGLIARAASTVSVNTLPPPGLLATLRSPPIALARRLTKTRPRPAPP